ncbi:MAG TPA: NUDIX domain-containing protein [Candidatus Binatia bacterium]|nr:NUDIX domain-containing protein [Candidatus Binatia bacterium]
MIAQREFPDSPRAGVGAVVFDGDRVLLVRRGRPPAAGKWSLPGGLIELGERIQEAAAREVAEECGLRVRVGEVCGVIDRVIAEPDPAGGEARIRYHWVIIDFVAEVVDGHLQAGSDAAEARWVPLGELGDYDTTDGLADMIRRAMRVRQEGGAVR